MKYKKRNQEKKIYKNQILNHITANYSQVTLQYAITIKFTDRTYGYIQYCSQSQKQLHSNKQFFFIQFLPDKIIGTGDYGIAYEASYKSDPSKIVIIKTSTFSSEALFQQEYDPIAILVDGLASMEMIQKNPHPNIVNYKFAGIDLDTKKIYEVMEYCDLGTVFSKHDGFTPDEALEVCYQVASGLNHLHSLKITHRDVKSDNIYIQKDLNGKLVFKLADFGLSCMKPNIKTVTGNTLFKAPEAIGAQQKLSNKIDIWGLGVIIYRLIFKLFSFYGKNEGLVENYILKGFVYPQKEAQKLNLHPEVRYLFEGMFEKDPDKRFSAKRIMIKIDEIRNLKLTSFGTIINYTSLSAPKILSNIKMNNNICFSGRGIAKSNNQSYFTMDECGKVQHLSSSNNSAINRQQFDVGNPDNLTSIVTNKYEDYLIVSGYSNKNIYVVNQQNLQTIRILKQTHTDDLTASTFLDSSMFCTGYSDGLLKKYNAGFGNELGNFKLCESQICSFYVDNNSTELLIGDSNGKLHSMNWQSFDSVKWSTSIHQNWINSIYKFGSFFATGSDDNSIALLDSSAPPQVISRYQTDSSVYQLQLTASCSNIFVLCAYKFILFKINAGQLQKLGEKSYQTDFKNQDLQSFALLGENNVIVGDSQGNLFLMKLVK